MADGPQGRALLIYTLIQGSYQPSRLMTSGDTAVSSAIKDFELDLEAFFAEMNGKSDLF